MIDDRLLEGHGSERLLETRDVYTVCVFLSLSHRYIVSNGNRPDPMQYACRPLPASLQVFLQVASRCTKWPPVAAERCIYRRWFRCVSGPPHGGRGGRCFAYPPLRHHFAYAAASARDWPGPETGGRMEGVRTIDVNQAQLLVALQERLIIAQRGMHTCNNFGLWSDRQNDVAPNARAFDRAVAGIANSIKMLASYHEASNEWNQG